jgi:hypothetical protein
MVFLSLVPTFKKSHSFWSLSVKTAALAPPEPLVLFDINASIPFHLLLRKTKPQVTEAGF